MKLSFVVELLWKVMLYYDLQEMVYAFCFAWDLTVLAILG